MFWIDFMFSIVHFSISFFSFSCDNSNFLSISPIDFLIADFLLEDTTLLSNFALIFFLNNILLSLGILLICAPLLYLNFKQFSSTILITTSRILFSFFPWMFCSFQAFLTNLCSLGSILCFSSELSRSCMKIDLILC